MTLLFGFFQQTKARPAGRPAPAARAAGHTGEAGPRWEGFPVVRVLHNVRSYTDAHMGEVPQSFPEVTWDQTTFGDRSLSICFPTSPKIYKTWT